MSRSFIDCKLFYTDERVAQSLYHSRASCPVCKATNLVQEVVKYTTMCIVCRSDIQYFELYTYLLTYLLNKSLKIHKIDTARLNRKWLLS